MKIRRILTAITIFLVVVICGVSTGFAIFYFAPEDKVTTIDDNRIDDIKENYVFSDTENEDSWYDVYFFAQPLAASGNGYLDINSYQPDTNTVRTITDPDSRSELTGNFFGFWENSVSNQNITKQDIRDTSGHYVGYRHIRVYNSLSTSDVEAIGNVCSTKGYNQRSPGTRSVEDYWYHFTGWTNDREKALTAFETPNEDFGFFDVNSPLSKVDQASSGSSNIAIDGSYVGDNVIYLYPILSRDGGDGINVSTFKLTGEQDNSEFYFLSHVNLHTATDSDYHYSLGNDDATYSADYYYFNNLTIDSKNANKNFRLEAKFLTTNNVPGNATFLIGNNYTDGNGNHTARVPGDLFLDDGVYNIHVYAERERWRSSLGFNDDHTGVNTKYSDAFKNYSNELSGVIVRSFYDSSLNNVGDDISTGWTPHWNISFNVYVLVERVYEFKPLGGVAQNNFDYEQASRYFYRGEIGTNRDNTIDGDYFYYTYGLNNVYVGSSSETFNSDVVGSSDNETVHSIFRSNVFTIDFWNTPWILKIEEFNDDELRSIQSYDEDMQHAETISGDGLLQEAKWDPNPNEDVTTLSSDYDYKLSSDLSQDFPDLKFGQARRTMLKITRPGYYNFRIQVQFLTNISSDELTQYIYNIKIAIAPADNSYFVKIYNANPTALDENNFVIEPEQAINSFYYYSNSLAVNSTSDFFSDQSLSTPSQSIWKWWLNYKEQKGLSDDVKLKDHVTGREVTEDFVLEGKNYIFYIEDSAA